jgi:hypothetical protein
MNKVGEQRSVQFSVPPEAAADSKGINIAIVRLNMDPASDDLINIGWLPEFFAVGPITSALRDELVRVLRLHADMVESEKIDERMEQIRRDGA